ncbi:MAG: phage portal protein, partial [Peptostreptococcus anaerobius]
ASFEQLTEFIKMYLEATTDYNSSDKDKIDIIFNKDVLINESQVIEDINNSMALLSMETLIENHPYIDDPAKELERIKSERAEQEPVEINTYGLGGEPDGEE